MTATEDHVPCGLEGQGIDRAPGLRNIARDRDIAAAHNSDITRRSRGKVVVEGHVAAIDTDRPGDAECGPNRDVCGVPRLAQGQAAG